VSQKQTAALTRVGAERGGASVMDDGPDAVDVRQLVVEYWAALRRRWRLVLAATVIAGLPFAGYMLLAVPVYTSVGAVQVASANSQASLGPLSELAGSVGGPEIGTEVEIMKRHDFQLSVLKGLKLNVQDPDQARHVTLDLATSIGGRSPVSRNLGALRESVENVEPRVDLRKPALVQASTNDGRMVIEYPSGDRFAAGQGERLVTPDFSMSVTAVPELDGTLDVQILPDGGLLDKYRSQITVRSLGSFREPTSVVQVSVKDTDRNTARAIVGSMMDLYLEQSLEWQTVSASSAADFIQAQLEEVSAKLQTSEGALSEYSSREGAVGLETQAEVAISSLAALETERIRLETQERVLGGAISRLARTKTGKPAHLTANYFEDEVLVVAVGKLTDAETAYARLRATLTPEHPRLAEAREQLEKQKREVLKLMRSARQTLRDTAERVKEEISAGREDLAKYPEKQLELARRVRDLEVSERLYVYLLEKRQEAEIMRASTTIDKRVIDEASYPYKKSSPSRIRLFALGLGASLFAGVLAGLLAHAIRTRLDTVEEIRRVADLPVMGVIPLVEGVADQSSGGGDLCHPAAVWKDTHGRLAEAFRALSASVALVPAEKGCQIILVTSGQPGEGKSTVSANLAAAMARSGRNACLLDLDLRRATQHRVWRRPRAPGVSDAISAFSRKPASDVFSEYLREQDSLSVMFAGTHVPDSFTTISSNGFEGLIAWASQEFDVVVVDCAPAFVPETVMIAGKADFIALVCRPGATGRGNLRRAIASLERVRAGIGLVVNGVGRGHESDSYGGTYYYSADTYSPEQEGADRDSQTRGPRAAS